MIFTIFRDFSEFFLIFNDFIFYLNRFKINKKNKKNILLSRGARVDATWHGRPRGSATQSRAAPRGAYISIILL